MTHQRKQGEPITTYKKQQKNPLEPLRDFRNFMFLIWQHLGLPAPTKVQYDIAHFMQHCPDRTIIEAFRGVGKSYIAVAFVVWKLFWNPDFKVMVVSASKQRADDFSTFAHRIITEIEMFMHMKARPDQRWSCVSFDVAGAKPSGSPSVKSVGITGQLTGSRADLIIADDVESPNNSMTQPMREKLKESVKEFDAVLKPNGTILYLGTPQNEQSLYNILIPRGYALRVWPSEYPSIESIDNDEWGHLAPLIEKEVRENPSLVGKPTDPLRFDAEDLAKRRLSYGAAGYALQFLLRTNLADAERHPLKLSDLIICSCDPETAPDKYIYGIFKPLLELPNVGLPGDKFYAPEETIGRDKYEGIMMAIDPSGRGSDEMAVAVTAVHNGYVHLMRLAAFRGTGYSPENLTAIAQLAKQYKVNAVLIESNFGDGMFKALLEPILLKTHPCAIEEVRQTTQKEARIISTLEPVISQHRLIVDPKVIEYDFNSVQHLPPEKAFQYMLFYQLTRLTKDKGCLAHDDRLDVVAMAVKYWLDVLNLSAEDEYEKKKAEFLEEHLKAIEGTLRGDIDPTAIRRINSYTAQGFIDDSAYTNIRTEWYSSYASGRLL